MATISPLRKGLAFARYVGCLAAAHGVYSKAAQLAERFKDSPHVAGALAGPPITHDLAENFAKSDYGVAVLKAAVAAGSTSDTAWGGPLSYFLNMASEFVAVLRPTTILGKLPVRSVPFQIRFPTQSGGATMAWIGEGSAYPVSKAQLSSSTFAFAKAGGIMVVTQELAQFSSPVAQNLLLDDMLAACRVFLDGQFIDPGVAAVANTSPASILNGVTAIQSTGFTATQIAADLQTAVATLADANEELDSAYWIMTPTTASALASKRSTTGALAFPDVTARGGVLLGFPVITSNSVPHSTSAGSIIAFVAAGSVNVALDSAAVAVSGEAALQLDSAPTQTSTTPTASNSVSLYQVNSVGIRLSISANWAKRRSTAAVYIDNYHNS